MELITKHQMLPVDSSFENLLYIYPFALFQNVLCSYYWPTLPASLAGSPSVTLGLSIPVQLAGLASTEG